MEFVKNLQSFLQSCNKSLINQTCSGPYWENIGPRADILPVRPSRLVNKIYVFEWERCVGKRIQLSFSQGTLIKANLHVRFFTLSKTSLSALKRDKSAFKRGKFARPQARLAMKRRQMSVN